MCHIFFFSLFKQCFKAIESENFCSIARFSFKRHFLSYSFCSLGLKSVFKKEKNVTMQGGSEKCQVLGAIHTIRDTF